jgi:LAO/AO transport system kinase
VLKEQKIFDASSLLRAMRTGDYASLARVLTWVENELPGAPELLLSLQPDGKVPVVGLTGPPGAGKSTLINALIREWTSAGKRVAVLAVDPTSPFNYGSLLGDRLRMSEHFTNPLVYIRSVATRGSLGGLSEKVIELTDVLRSAAFDLILVETVGVGQSEIEIAGLADITVVVVVPEAGDEVQTMKSGIMEIADVFVVNKADREGADSLVHALRLLTAHPRQDGWTVPVVKASATKDEGTVEILDQILRHRDSAGFNSKKTYLLTEKAYRLIQQRKMQGISKTALFLELEKSVNKGDFNLYRFVAGWNEGR